MANRTHRAPDGQRASEQYQMQELVTGAVRLVAGEVIKCAYVCAEVACTEAASGPKSSQNTKKETFKKQRMLNVLAGCTSCFKCEILTDS